MKITIDTTTANQRLDRFLRKWFKQYPEVTLTDIFSRIRKGAIKVNAQKKKENYRLEEQDTISRDDTIVTEKKANDATRSKKEKIRSYPLEDIREYIVYEDVHRLVFNKPAGIAMHPGHKHMNRVSLHDLLQSYLEQTKQHQHDATFTPSFCFRLDRDTSGIVIAAKTYPALQELNQLIRQRNVSKTYIAVASGITPEKTTIDAPLFKGYDKVMGKGKMFVNHATGVEARTDIHTLTTRKHPLLGDISLVKVDLYTGRMHQIRVHMSHIGHPLLGDLMYGNPALNRMATKHEHISRQLLHSRNYGFFDSFSHKQVTFTAPLPSHIHALFPQYT